MYVDIWKHKYKGLPKNETVSLFYNYQVVCALISADLRVLKKYEQYFGNIISNEDDYKILTENKCLYAVRNKKSLKVDNKQVCSGEYYWITTSNNQGVIFYQN